MSIADELQKLDALRTSGALSEDEYAKAKGILLNGGTPAGSTSQVQPNLLKRLTRSSRDVWLGGVCGGLGANTSVPSWAWRVGFCLLLFAAGVGVVPYVLLWIFMPLDVDAARDVTTADQGRGQGSAIRVELR